MAQLSWEDTQYVLMINVVGTNYWAATVNKMIELGLADKTEVWLVNLIWALKSNFWLIEGLS